MRNPILVGERVYLRALEVDDAGALAHAVTEETEPFFLERGRLPAGPLGFERWLAERPRHRPPTEVNFAVCLKADDRFLGVTTVRRIDWVNRTAETGIGLAPAAVRGQGYGVEAKHLLLEYCFDRLHLHAMTAHVFEPNTRSAAALVKQGYRPAGRLKWDALKDGVYRDARLFDLLRDEWLAAREAWRATQEARAPAETGPR